MRGRESNFSYSFTHSAFLLIKRMRIWLERQHGRSREDMLHKLKDLNLDLQHACKSWLIFLHICSTCTYAHTNIQTVKNKINPFKNIKLLCCYERALCLRGPWNLKFITLQQIHPYPGTCFCVHLGKGQTSGSGVCVETCYPRAWLGWARRKWSPGSTSSPLMYQCQYIQILALFPCGVSQKMKTALFYELLLWNSLLWTVIYLSFHVSEHHKKQTPQWLNCLYESSFQRGKRWKPTYATTLYDTSVWEGSYQF